MLPRARVFSADGASCSEIISIEELEAVRLCDLESLSQDEAARRMNVSRGTFQRILYAARKKIAAALCQGHDLEIRGGNYEVAQEICTCTRRCRNCRLDEKERINHE